MIISCGIERNGTENAAQKGGNTKNTSNLQPIVCGYGGKPKIWHN